jgi:hypothetical protein
MSNKKETKHAVGDEEISRAAGMLFRPAWITNRRSLWPGIRQEMDARSGSRSMSAPAASRVGLGPFSIRTWAAASALILAISAGFILIGLRSSTVGSIETAGTSRATNVSGPRIEIVFAALEGSPAKAFLFQTPEISYVGLAPANVIEKKERP